MHNPIITFSVLSFLPGTSDRNPAKVSEVPRFFPTPPTETAQKCRRSPFLARYLRHKPHKSVGGTSLLGGDGE